MQGNHRTASRVDTAGPAVGRHRAPVTTGLMAAGFALLAFLGPATADTRITTCAFPKLTRSLIMPEVKVLFDTVTHAASIQDALILKVKGKPIRAAVKEFQGTGKVLFVVKWRLEGLPASTANYRYSRVDYVLKVERSGRAVIETVPPNGMGAESATGRCS